MSARLCPQCRAELPADSPEGLCPTCLLRAGMPSQRSTASYGASFRPPEPLELAPFFPQLEVLELLGQGGMGAVYKARQLRLDRLVALKILPPEVGGDPAFAERFLREARTLAKLSHPHVVGIHDFGEADGYYYFLMEYVDGVNLRQALQAGRLTPEQALRIVPQVCDALQYAHDKGVVHRDVKPENVLLDSQGRVKIADFGLAKLLGREVAVPTLTRTRQVMGTPHYMAPEQMERPETVDHRADIFSLGVLFYEMLTGELPLGRFPVPSSKVQIDVRLDEVVLRTLEKEPARRYQKVSEVRSEVEAIADRRRAAPARAAAPAAGRVGAFPVMALLACGMVLVASFLPWVDLATAWHSNLRIGELELPNWLAAVAAVHIAVLSLARYHGSEVPQALIPALAAYGLGHSFLVGWILLRGSQPELAHILSAGAFLYLLLTDSWRDPVAAPKPGLSANERRAILRRVRWPAAALMAVGILGCAVWGAILVTAASLAWESQSHVSSGPPTPFCVVVFTLFVISWIVTWGARDLSQLTHYRLAVWTPRLALFPLGPLGWPAALWGWWAVSRPEVRSAFHRQA